MPIDIEALRHIPLFAPLSQEELAHVAALTVERHYDRGAMILLEGDMGGALHYVRSGMVKVYKTSPAGKDQVLRIIAAGNTFNDVPALDGGPNPASAAALEPSTIYVISRVELRKLILTRPEVAEAVVKTLANALRHLVTLVEDLSFDWKANYPGVFMYHCGAPVVIYHMTTGMYGAIIVDPAQGWVPAQEYVLVQSEFYTPQLPDG